MQGCQLESFHDNWIFSGTVSAWLAVCREEDANEGAGWWKEGHENIGNPESSTKATPPFEREPLEVQHQKGTQVVTKTRDGCTITQSMADFMMVPYQTSEEAGRWKSRPCASQEELPKPSGDPSELPRMKEQPQEVQILEFDTRILRELGTRPQSAQQSYLSHPLPQEARGHTCNRGISQEQISRARVTRQFPVTK